MTHVILPAEGGSGVEIYPLPADLPGAAATGTIASVVSDGTLRQFDGTNWDVIGSTGAPYTVSDSDTLDLTLALNVLSGVVKLSAAAPGVGHLGILLDAQTDGVRAQLPIADLYALFGVVDSPSIDMGYLDGAFAAALKLSAAAAAAGNQLALLDIQTDGLRVQVADTAIRSVLSWSDTNSLDGSYDAATGAFSASAKYSAAAAAAGFLKVDLDTQADGIRAQLENADITALLAVADSNSIDLGYDPATGIFSSSVRISANAADASHVLVPLDIQGASSLGLRAQLPFATAAVPGGVSTAAQSYAGDKTFEGQTTLAGGATLTGTVTRTNNATNATFVASNTPATAGASAANLQTCTATFEGQGCLFLVEVGGNGAFMAFVSAGSTAVQIMSDPNELALVTDAGSGVFVSKAGNTITLKNRLGTNAIRVRSLCTGFTSTTAWA